MSLPQLHFLAASTLHNYRTSSQVKSALRYTAYTSHRLQQLVDSKASYDFYSSWSFTRCESAKLWLHQQEHLLYDSATSLSCFQA
ncbi:hypothetical protein E2C01_003823 [Portunus trituberculatus]|uniref:Uncharacterized protein n=1 Tax=Portunus trituberculatus TaxID=210409 RepID=A0A5B7CPN7_PORTR|nr:hypothetical protein [Portunus trituberculatus]